MSAGRREDKKKKKTPPRVIFWRGRLAGERLLGLGCAAAASSAPASASPGEQRQRVASHVTANTFVGHQQIGAKKKKKSKRFNFSLISRELSLEMCGVYFNF